MILYINARLAVVLTHYGKWLPTEQVLTLLSRFICYTYI